MAGKFAAPGLIDVFIPVRTLPCTYSTYDSDKCQMMSLMLGNKAELDDEKLDGEELSYTIRQPEKDKVFEVSFGDRDFNSMKLTEREAGVTTEAEWTRDKDGTERT